jgi:hypothetical protein
MHECHSRAAAATAAAASKKFKAVFRCPNSGLNSASARVTVAFYFYLVKNVQKLIN